MYHFDLYGSRAMRYYITMATTYVYTRVSTDKQSTTTQEHDLYRRFPDGIVVTETASGFKHRPKLEEVLKLVKPGDTIAVAGLDRLGRKTAEILSLIEQLHKDGVNVISLRESLDYSTPMGKMVTQVLIAVAELERSLISQRTKAALQAKKAQGIKLGRVVTHGAELTEKAKALRASGFSHLAIAQATGMSLTTVSRRLAAAS